MIINKETVYKIGYPRTIELIKKRLLLLTYNPELSIKENSRILKMNKSTMVNYLKDFGIKINTRYYSNL